MLKIKRAKNEMGTFNYEINNGETTLGILYGGNLDLYFYVPKKDIDNKNETVNFDITKENYVLYSLFEKLYNDVINCRVYELHETDIEFCDSEEELAEKEAMYEEWNKELKDCSEYEDLVRDGVISWRHDDQMYDEANILNIYKEDDKYRLEFILRSQELSHVIDVRFRNSGSRYHPFHILFMKLFNELQKYDPEYHQIHMEEYMYQKTFKK